MPQQKFLKILIPFYGAMVKQARSRAKFVVVTADLPPICQKARILAEACDARFSFACATCGQENRAVLPDHFWSHTQTWPIQIFGGRCFSFRRTIPKTAPSA